MLNKKEFDAKVMKLQNVYLNPNLKDYTLVGNDSEKVKEVYGAELKFRTTYEDRPYIFGSFVTTIDGKLAYEDYPGAFEVAGRNHFAEAGGLTDFWWLNVLRSACDALILGAKSITLEEDYTGHCWDADLEQYRIENGKDAIPMNIVVSTDAKDIPLHHMLFANASIPSAIACAPDGIETIQNGMTLPYEIVGPYQSVEEIKEDEVLAKFQEIKNNKTIVFVTGEKANPNIKVLLKLLKICGVDRLLSESPTYTHLLIKQEVFDEGFFNMSCVYIGGNAVSLGKFDKAFSALYHPHTEILSIAMHSPHMLFFRHKFIYGIETK